MRRYIVRTIGTLVRIRRLLLLALAFMAAVLVGTVAADSVPKIVITLVGTLDRHVVVTRLPTTLATFHEARRASSFSATVQIPAEPGRYPAITITMLFFRTAAMAWQVAFYTNTNGSQPLLAKGVMLRFPSVAPTARPLADSSRITINLNQVHLIVSLRRLAEAQQSRIVAVGIRRSK